MPKIISDEMKGIFQIRDYNGFFDKQESIPSSCFFERGVIDIPWDFFRERSNHAYILGGKIFYEGKCNNNLVISSYAQNRLVDVRNAFILVRDYYAEVSPIFDLRQVISRCMETLSIGNINYNIPERVFRRENLPELDPCWLMRKIKEKYRIELREVYRIEHAIKSKNKAYYAIGKNGKEYVIKYREENKTRAELISTILAKVPAYFPKVYSGEDCEGSYTFEAAGKLYGLEDYVRGTSREKDLDYFDSIGSHIALLDEYLLQFMQNNEDLEEIISMEGINNESNIVSTYIDLTKDRDKHSYLLSQLEEIIEEDLSKKMRSLPRSLIHRDLNRSNIIWVGQNPVIIDSDTLKISERINEFVALLLLSGEMRRPGYIKGSLPVLIDSYNSSSKHPLSREETYLLPVLLRYSLLKHYVIRTIRRNMEDRGYLKELEETLNKLKEIR